MNCIDSDFAIAILKGDQKTKELLDRIESEGDIYITSISIFEITYSTADISKRKEQALMNLLDTLKVLPLDKKSALVASDIGRKLSERGEMLHPMDILIGAIALQYKMRLITNNVEHFSRIKGLEILSW